MIFIENASDQRTNDFFEGERNFQYISLAEKSAFLRILTIIEILSNTGYKHLVIGGWDYVEFWVSSFISPQNRNAVVVESSIFESATSGFKSIFKRVFLSRISRVYASGKAQGAVAETLKFKREIIITKGVGIFNIVNQPNYIAVNQVTKFLYVGRLSPEKNLELLVNTFNELPHLTLNIIGFGPMEKQLKQIAKNNTFFLGSIPNNELYSYYQDNHVFILPSLSEPWGIVVEEAFNNGIPVIVSNRVGCAPEIVKVDENGIIFDINDENSLRQSISKICDIKYYNFLRFNISKLDFEKIAEAQVSSYI